jgi:hypothetical protein
MAKRTSEDYYKESKRIREEVLQQAELLKDRPLHFIITNEGKHFESAYFAYFSRELGCRTILCMRKLADGEIYKPYAIINDHTFAEAESELRK